MLAGCATTTNPDSLARTTLTSRPIVISSRSTSDRQAVARPVAVFYNHAVPEPFRLGLHNVLGNLNLPVTFANDVFQGEAVAPARPLAVSS